jgi:hypothetical protein
MPRMVRSRIDVFDSLKNSGRSGLYQRGWLVAKALQGAWRPDPTPLDLSVTELQTITPFLLLAGAGALGWYRIRGSQLVSGREARQLQQAYRFHAIRAAMHMHALTKVLHLLNHAGVEPIVIKGWTVARLYPEPGLRPYGDFDIVVPPDQYATAATVLQGLHVEDCFVDLHAGLAKLIEHPLDELYARSLIVPLDDVAVRILAPEDQLRLLCKHLWLHNAWRPAWLCDIAIMLESRPAEFDWDRCLGHQPRRAGWVACALGLAHRLLGARIEETPVPQSASRLPRWLVAAVLRQWGRVQRPGQGGTELHFLARHWRDPARLWQEARWRWDMPLSATVQLGGPFNHLPRFPFQLGLALAHIPAWWRELGNLWCERRRAGSTPTGD